MSFNLLGLDFIKFARSNDVDLLVIDSIYELHKIKLGVLELNDLAYQMNINYRHSTKTIYQSYDINQISASLELSYGELFKENFKKLSSTVYAQLKDKKHWESIKRIKERDPIKWNKMRNWE